MAEKLHFTLVSPEKELYSAEVDHVVVPGIEGDFQVLVNHAPFMTVLAPGMLEVSTGDGKKQFFVKGGFADVTPEGLTVLAEYAIAAEDLTSEILEEQRTLADKEVEAAEEDADLSFLASRTKQVLASL